MKKFIYISLFIFLGILVQHFLHTIIEIGYIKLLITDFDKYGFGMSWNAWFLVHHIFGILLLIAGAMIGYWQGKYWWPKLYDENGRVRNPKPWQF